MAKVDLTLLKEKEKELEKGDGGNMYLSQRKLKAGEPAFIRFMPPVDELNGLFYITVIKYWIGDKPYISHTTFGNKCAIAHELNKANNSEDDSVLALADKIKMNTEYWSLVLHLEYREAKGGVEEIIVIDDTCKVFQYGRQVLKDVNKLFLSRAVLKAGEEGLVSRKSGFNVEINKSGTGKNTEYKASLADQWEAPAKYYREMPNIVEICKAQLKSNKYLQALMRQYLYGEDIPAAVQKAEDEREAARKAEYKRQQQAKAATTDAEAPKRRKKEEEEVEDIEDLVDVKKGGKYVEDVDEALAQAAKKKTVSKKPVDEDFEEEELDEVIEKAPVKKAATKKAVKDDDFEEEEPKPTAKKRNIASDLAKVANSEDDDDEDF